MGGIAHISLDGACYRLISGDMAKPDRMIFDLAEGQKEKLEALRVGGGFRSFAEVLRALIDEAHEDMAPRAAPTGDEAAVGKVVHVTTAVLDEIVEQSRSAAATVPMFVPKAFNPQPKKGGKK